MSTLAPLALDFIRNLSKAIRAFRIYAPNHRETQKSIDDAFGSLQKMTQAGPVTLGAKDGTLILENAPLRDASPAVKGFCDMLTARNIAAFRVEPGLTSAEMTHFLKLMAMSPEELLREHKIRPDLLEPLRSIRVNEVKFIAVQSDISEESIGLAGGGGPPSHKLSQLLAAILSKNAPSDPESGEGTSELLPESPTDLRGLGAALAPFMSGADKAQTVALTSRLFDQIVDESLSNRPAEEFVDEYLKGVNALPEEIRKAVLSGGGADAATLDTRALIERLPLSLRGRVVAEDLGRGSSPSEKLRASVNRLAPTAPEFVRLYEMVSRMTVESSASSQEEQRRSESLLTLLPLSQELKRKRRSVLLFSREPDDRLGLTRILEQGGLRVTTYSRSDASLPALLRTGAYDAVVADISRYHFSELQALASPEPGPRLPPILLLEDTVRVRDAAEAALCPEGRFLYKPVEATELLATIDELAPRGKEEDAPSPPAEEVEQASELKPHLQPQELPAIPGATVAVHYRAGAAPGGNCHEVVALPGKRTGIFLLDVPGFGSIAPAVLFAARAMFLRVARQCETPAKALTKLNEALGRALPRGPFVQAGYAILEPATGQLTVACAGLPRPIRWNDDAPGVKLIHATGLPLGPSSGPAFERALRSVTVALAPGDHVLFHTDGVTEAISAAFVPFGERRMAQATGRAPHGSAGSAVVEVIDAVLSHAGAKPLVEDLTIFELHREKATVSETAP